MAKAIKFNLIIDKQPIRNLEDLQEHFNVEDLLEAFHNGSLKRWLAARDLQAQLTELEKITGGDLEAARGLCRIFYENCTPEQIEAGVYPFTLRKQEQENLQRFKTLKDQRNEIISAYHKGYEQLLDQIENKGEDYPFLKAAVQEIFEKYAGLYRLNAKDYYNRFISSCPLVMLTQIANQNMRSLLPHDLQKVYGDMDISALTRPKIADDAVAAFFAQWKQNPNQAWVKCCNSMAENADLRRIGKPILMLDCNEVHDLDGKIIVNMDTLTNYWPFTYINLSDIPKSNPVSASTPVKAPAHVKTFAGQTEGYWKDVEPQGRRFLLIKMESGNILRNSGKNGEELKAEDVNGKFPILDGIDYKSNNPSHQLVYMEV